MSVVATILNGNVHLSGNPIKVEVQGSGAPAGSTSYKLLLKVIPVYDVVVKGGPFTDGIAPDTDNKALFDIHGYVDVNVPVDIHWPVENVVTGHINRTIDIQIQPGESYIDENDELQETWGEVTGTYFVVKGGVNGRTLARWNQEASNFEAEFVEGAKFLTNLPRSMKVLPDQFVKLCLLFPYGEAFTSSLLVTVYYDDDTSEEFETLYEAYTDALYEYNLYLPGLGVEVQNETRKALYYEVRVACLSGYTETFTFALDWTPYEDPAQLFYLASPGGIDCIALTGDVETGFEAASVEAVMPLPSDATIKSRTVVVASRKGALTWTINTGWKERAVMAAFADALVTKLAWLWYRGEFYPVYVTSQSTPLDDKFSGLQSATITLMHAHNSPFN